MTNNNGCNSTLLTANNNKHNDNGLMVYKCGTTTLDQRPPRPGSLRVTTGGALLWTLASPWRALQVG